MNYNDTQFAELSKFEENFRTSLGTPTGWTRRIAIPDQRRIKAIYTEATGERVPYNIGCGNCLLSLLKKAGKLYFADKAEKMEKMREKMKDVEIINIDPWPATEEEYNRVVKKMKEMEAPVPEPEFDPAPVEPAQKPAKKATKKDGEKTPAKKTKAAKTEK